MKTPGIYTDINTQTQRTGLPTQDHRIVFVTGDTEAPTNPTPIYDTATADIVSGANSNAGRMIAAALSVSQGVRVETVGKSQSSDDNSFDWSSLSLNDIVVLDGNSDGFTNFEAEINGKIYNKDGGDGDLNNALYDLNIMNIGGGSYEDQGHILEIYNLSPAILNVKLTALPSQMNTTTKFIDGKGVVLDGNVFLFRLAVSPR